MEEPNLDNISKDISAPEDPKVIQNLSTNWRITQDNKKLCDAVSTIAASEAPSRLTLEEIVTDDSCVILQPANGNLDDQREACVIDINLNKGRRISRIGVVSEASVLEFFKESGEYADTGFAELLDEFEDSTVYFLELSFKKAISQISIKFTRIHNSRSNIYVYGIKLILEEEKSLPNYRNTFEDILKSSCGKNLAFGTKLPMGMPDLTNIPDYDGNFSTEMDACLRSFMGKALTREKPRKNVAEKTEEKIQENGDTGRIEKTSIEVYIDKKFREMEKRLVQKIDEAEERNSKKLDAILKLLESRNSS